MHLIWKILLTVALCWILTTYIIRPYLKLIYYRKKGAVTYFFPMLGIMQKIFGEGQKQGDFGFYSKQLIKQKPDLKILASNFGSNVSVAIYDPTLAKEMLQNQHRYKKGPFFRILKLLAAKSLLTTEGEYWKSSRRVIAKVFHFDHLRKLIPIIQRATNETLKTQLIGKEVDTLEMLRNLFGGLFAEFFFGANVKNDNLEGKTVQTFFAGILTDFAIASLTPLGLIFGSSPVKLGLTPFYRSIMRNLRIFREYAENIIQQKRQALKNKSSQSGQDQKDLLDIMLECEEAGENFSADELIDNFMAFFGGGTDSSSHLLQIVIYLLDQNPEYKKELRDEIKSVIKDPTQGITLDQVNQLEFTTAIIKESLRVVPPFPNLMQREVTADHYIGDFFVPKGSIMYIDILALNYHPRRFENSEKFNPYRWMKGHPDFNEEVSKDPFVYLPFSGGPRNCIGQPLAMLEIKIILAMFVSQFDWKVREGYKLKLEMKSAYGPMENVPIILKPLEK
mgnify:CR=1 FL=1